MEPVRKTTYQYIPDEDTLVILYEGKASGKFVGNMAHKKFMELLESGFEISIGGDSMSKNAKVRQLRALWIKQGCDKYREDILEPFGVTSTKDLTEPQLDRLIATFSHDRKSDAPLEVRNARSVILKLLMDMGIYDNSGDWKRVNAFMMDKRISGKLLYQMSMEEMKALTAKLRAIIEKDKKQKRELNRIITSN